MTWKTALVTEACFSLLQGATDWASLEEALCLQVRGKTSQVF
jgi:hypothetical protein